MTRARDIADLGQDKSTLASYVDTGVTSTDLERIDITTEGTSENSKVVTADSSGHVTLAGELRGPATLVIDPAVVGNNTGLLQVKGNLQVDGTTTTINSETLTVDDKNIVLGSGAADSAAADGAGLTIDGASATMLYTHSTTSFDFNKPVNVTGAFTASGNVGIGVSNAYYQIDNRFTNNDTSFTGGSSGNWGSNGIRIENESTTVDSMASLHFRCGGNADIHIASIFKSSNAADLGVFFEGVEKFKVTSSGNATLTGSIAVDDIIEKTSAHGVEIDGVTLKDSSIDGVANLDGSVGAHIGNSHATGYGVKIRGASDSTRYALTVNNNADNPLMRVLGDGNVGIGTTSPDHELHVKGNITIDNESETVPSILHFNALNKTNYDPTSRICFWEGDQHNNNYTTSHMFIEYNGGSIGGANGYLSIGGDCSTSNEDVLVVNRLGRVGIGTTSPVAVTDISQSQNTTNQFTSPHLALTVTNVTDNTGFTGISYASSVSNNYGWTAGALRSQTDGNGDFVFNHHNNSASGTEYMRITRQGHLLLPSHPVFMVSKEYASSTTEWSGDSGYTFFGVTSPCTFTSSDVIIDQGSNFSHSNGRFTAPVSGVYFFTYQFSIQWEDGSSEALDMVMVVDGTDEYGIFQEMEESSISLPRVLTLTHYIDLSKNQYVNFGVRAIGNPTFAVGEVKIGGHLVG